MFSSVNASFLLAPATSNGKRADFHVIDVWCLSVYKQRSIWESWKKNQNYNCKELKIKHKESDKCWTNHFISFGAFQSVDAVEVCWYFIKVIGLVYNQYLGEVIIIRRIYK